MGADWRRMPSGLALLVLTTWLQSAAASQIQYASIQGAAQAYSFANNSDEAVNYMKNAILGQSGTPSAIHFFLRLKGIQTISTKDKTIALTTRLIALWNASNLACGPLAETGNACGWSPQCCSESVPQPGLLDRPARPCYVHPPLVSPQVYASTFPAAYGVMPFPCYGSTGNSTSITPTTHVTAYESFTHQVWTPDLEIENEAVGKPVGRPMINAALGSSDSTPYDGSTSGTVSMFLQTGRQSTVKCKFDLHQYPFDVQTFNITFMPPLSEPAANYKMRPYISTDRLTAFDKAVLATTTDITDLLGIPNDKNPHVGLVVNGFEITKVTTMVTIVEQEVLNILAKSPFYALVLQITVERKGLTIFNEYGMTAIIIYACAWGLLFVDNRIPPAVAGVVTAQVVLLIISNNLAATMRHALPAGTKDTFLDTFLKVIVYLQILHLLVHLIRMKLTSDKDNKIDVFSRIARICTLALFICIVSLIHFIYLWDRMPDSIKGLLIVAMLVSVVVAVLGCLYCFRLEQRANAARARHKQEHTTSAGGGLDDVVVTMNSKNTGNKPATTVDDVTDLELNSLHADLHPNQDLLSGSNIIEGNIEGNKQV